MDAPPQLVLAYETPPEHVPAFARRPLVIVVLIGIVPPGLSSWLLRGRRGVLTFLGLSGGLLASFLFFGPFWGEVLFRGTRYQEWGLWPFLAACAAACVTGGILASRDRRRALSRGVLDDARAALPVTPPATVATLARGTTSEGEPNADDHQTMGP